MAKKRSYDASRFGSLCNRILFCSKGALYGEILEGTSIETLASNGVTQVKEWNPEMYISEALSSSFQKTLEQDEGYEFFESYLQASSATTGEFELPVISQRKFYEVIEELAIIWQSWGDLLPGESIDRKFAV